MNKISKFTIALCQTKPTLNRLENIKQAKNMLEKAATKADILMLGEGFTTPFFPEFMKQNAEPIDGYEQNPQCVSARMMSEVASKYGKYIIGGSIPELRDSTSKIFNSCPCFNREGKIVAKHSKLHMFDVHVEGGISCQESLCISPGNSATLFETEYCKIGIGICYDVRFPEYISLLSKDPEVKMLCFPAAFNLTTGPLHWDILRKSRAIDSQSYFVFCAPSQNSEINEIYPYWGHSSIVDPWGTLLADGGTDECIIYQQVDLELVDKFRNSIPTLKNRRTDLFQVAIQE